MNITTKQIVQHFLSQHLKILANSKVFTRSSFFEDYFLREELIEMIKHTYAGEALKLYDLEKMTQVEMLELLNDADILDFYMNQWEKEVAHSASHTAQNVHDTLDQLGQQLHYLNFKILADWDTYDCSNFTALLKKAGRLRKVFGIYDLAISQEEVDSVTSPPKRFFDTYALAENALNELKLDDAHILFTFKTI